MSKRVILTLIWALLLPLLAAIYPPSIQSIEVYDHPTDETIRLTVDRTSAVEFQPIWQVVPPVETGGSGGRPHQTMKVRTLSSIQNRNE